MAKTAIPLSISEIKNAKPKDKHYKLYDGLVFISQYRRLAQKYGALIMLIMTQAKEKHTQ